MVFGVFWWLWCECCYLVAPRVCYGWLLEEGVVVVRVVVGFVWVVWVREVGFVGGV